MLYAAQEVLPDNQEKKKKLRASVQIALGHYYMELLAFGVNNYIEGRKIIPTKVQQKFVEFPELKLKWPVIKDIDNKEDAVQVFKLSNTQL